MVEGSRTERGVGGRRSQEVGAWLFPEIGLAATLHLHCGDRREGEGGGGGGGGALV